jgi:hypothetical protein
MSFKYVAIKKPAAGADTSRSAYFFDDLGKLYDHIDSRNKEDGSEWVIADVVLPWAAKLFRWLHHKSG